MSRANQIVSLSWVPIAWTVAVVGVLVPVAYFFLAQQRQDLDLNSGKLRFQTTLGPLVLSEDVRDSSFSRVIGGPVANSANPLWGRVLVSGFLREHGR